MEPFSYHQKHIFTLINEIKPPGVYRQLWKVTDKYRKENAPPNCSSYACSQAGTLLHKSWRLLDNSKFHLLTRYLPTQREAAAETAKLQGSPSPKPVRPQN